MRFAFERLKIVVEPSGATPLAALLAGRVDGLPRRVGVIVSGGNVDAAVLARLLADVRPRPPRRPRCRNRESDGDTAPAIVPPPLHVPSRPLPEVVTA
jgi:threonine dehydratase